MYALIVDYIKSPEEVAPHIEAHSQWVKKYLADGTLLLAGPKKSKLGGFLLAKSINKKALLKMIAEDPYVSEDVAEYRIVDFDCKLTVDSLADLKGV